MMQIRSINDLEDLELASGIYNELKFLLKNKEDFNDFKENFWLGKNMQATSWGNYRQCKLHERNMQLEEFIGLYEQNPIQGLEELFMQKVYQEDVDKLEKEISVNRLTLEKLYHMHKNKPMERLRYFLLRRG